jgi:hypothetical protein
MERMTDTTLQLYFVQHSDEDGNNFDLLVRATTESDAVAFWRQYYEFDYKPERVHVFPLLGPAGPLPWGE